MLPLRKEGIENRPRSRRTTLSARLRARSTTTNVARAAQPTARAIGTGDNAAVQSRPAALKGLTSLHHPMLRPSMRAKTTPPNPMTDSSAPIASTPVRELVSRDSSTSRRVPTMTSRPSGRLIPKAQRQENDVVSHPPSSGPRAAVPPMVDPQTAKAMPRSRPRNVVLSRESDVGSIAAPPTPCRTREPMSAGPDWLIAARTLASPKTTTPETKSRRRPNRSASRPHDRSSAAKTRV